MLYQRTGFPEEDELVLCTVTKIFPHSVFMVLDEFKRTGVVHISEIAPGRIRNIRNYVVLDKKVICKVLRVDEKKGHIDLSLRRVNDSQKRIKKNEIKQEQLAEKIVEIVARTLKKEKKQLYNEITEIIFEKYPNLYSCFEKVVSDKLSLESLGINKKLAQEFTKAIELRIKPVEVQIKGVLKLKSFAPNGVDIIKTALKKATETSKNITITYKSAGNYIILATANDYPTAEDILKKATEISIEYVEKEKGEASFKRNK